jgi:glycosyltransferase involved in cell wall biosynthesis
MTEPAAIGVPTITSSPSIPAVPAGTHRPFWSVMIPTYRPSPDFLQQTIRSVLDQAPSPDEMQIEVVDDCSPEFDPGDFVARRFAGRVGAHRHPRRLGMAGNWNAAVARARGRWVHLLHQDDLVLDGFYRRLGEGVLADPAVGAAVCQHYLIDGGGSRKTLLSRVRATTPGVLENWIEYVFVGLSFQTPAVVVRRDVYETLGGFDPRFRYVVDWDMWKRIAARFPVWFDPEPLACYRRHGEAASIGLMRTGTNIAEIRESIAASAPCLPEALRPEVTRRAVRYYAKHALRNAWKMLVQYGDVASSTAQLREARKMTSTLGLIRIAPDFVRSEYRRWKRE